jgi:hypothetical protein
MNRKINDFYRKAFKKPEFIDNSFLNRYLLPEDEVFWLISLNFKSFYIESLTISQ